MNSAQSTVPSTVSATPADAICSIGFGSDLFTGGANEANTFGSGVLISTTQILTAAHVMPDQSSGGHTLPTDASTIARVARFRRKLDGTCPAGGVCVDYVQRDIVSYVIPNPAKDIALCTLSSPITHIAPIAIDTGTPATSNAIDMGGWGLDGATLFSGSRPNDCRTIVSTKTISGLINDANGFNAYFTFSGTNPGPNLYDSGGPVMRTVSSAWAVSGIILSADAAINLIQFAHDASFQIPGLYTAAASSSTFSRTSWIDPTDTYIDDLLPTADYSASTSIGYTQVSGKGAQHLSIIFIFNLNAITSPITGATLTMFVVNPTISTGIRVNRIRRTGLTTLANWNTYDGTNNWTTPGAGDASNDIYSDNQFDLTVPATSSASEAVYITHANLLAMIQAAKAGDGYLRLLISVPIAVALGSAFYSADALNTSVQPRLELTTTADTSTRIRSGTDGTRSYMRAR